MSGRVYKTYSRACQRQEAVRKTTGVWTAIVGTDASGYHLLLEPPTTTDPGPGYGRTASQAEVAATGRQQQRAALEEMFGSNAEVIYNVCAKMAGPQVSDNVSAALAWGQEHPDATSRNAAYLTTSIRHAIRDKRYQAQPDGIPFSDDWLEWIRGNRRELPDDGEDGARLQWYAMFYGLWLDQFPEDDRECFKQVVMHRRSTRDVAADLGIPETTVRRKADKIRVEIEAQHRAHEVKLLAS
jgi:RNA polymerase sigma factor (sigma-70 family)